MLLLLHMNFFYFIFLHHDVIATHEFYYTEVQRGRVNVLKEGAKVVYTCSNVCVVVMYVQ